MKLTKDARIISVEGEDIGNLNRFVIHPRTKQVTHIVFEKGLLTKEEYVIPMQLVDHVDEKGIHLSALPAEDSEALPVFEEESYIVTDERPLLEHGAVSDDMIRSYYYYPPSPFGGSGTLRPGDMYIFNPPESAATATQVGVPVSGEAPVTKQVDQNIPDGTVALKEGAKVITSNYKHIGNIEKVIVDSRSARASHIMITKGLLFKERKMVPTDWIEEVAEDEVRLSIEDTFAERLPDYKEG
jgi:uncharacterized protein YrrD